MIKKMFWGLTWSSSHGSTMLSSSVWYVAGFSFGKRHVYCENSWNHLGKLYSCFGSRWDALWENRRHWCIANIILKAWPKWDQVKISSHGLLNTFQTQISRNAIPNPRIVRPKKTLITTCFQQCRQWNLTLFSSPSFASIAMSNEIWLYLEIYSGYYLKYFLYNIILK